jgi:aldose 1-epimerase
VRRAHGAVLVPWPNRLADGRYRFDGVDHQVALTEPDKANAIHGLLRWRSWRAFERTPSRVVVGTRLHPMMGYPFCLDVSVAYELGDGGLVVATTPPTSVARPARAAAASTPTSHQGPG